MAAPVTVFWFRRDLRLQDNVGLYHALKSEFNVLPIFIFDTNILDKLVDKLDARVQFIHDTLSDMKASLHEVGSDIDIRFGDPIKIWQNIIAEYDVKGVYTNNDYERYAIERDAQVASLLAEKGIPIKTYKDHVIFEKNEITKDDGLPYTVFTPYKKKWLSKLLDNKGTIDESPYFQSFDCQALYDHFVKVTVIKQMPSLGDMGFSPSDIKIPKNSVQSSLIVKYDANRNFPSIDGTSRLGIHFRFGTISIREKARKAASLSETYLSELIWRDFYAMILFQFPHVEGSAFRAEYDQIQWRNNENEFAAWCKGKTGYPIVDAGMRELLATGHMHNRVRMITASFLTKHLLIDWRWGETWFAQKLLDFDLASNNGGWQWAAGCGTDAAPYFRIFSPDAQTERFDKDKKYIKKWVPEFGTQLYPSPIVDHKLARERCLSTYKAGLQR